MKKLIILLPLLLCIGQSLAMTTATKGMVVTEQTLASDIGADVLKKGGNAIDIDTESKPFWYLLLYTYSIQWVDKWFSDTRLEDSG